MVSSMGRDESSNRSFPLRDFAEARAMKVQRAWEAFDIELFREDLDGVRFMGLSVRLGDNDRIETMVTVKVAIDGDRFVGFHSGPIASEAIAQALDKALDGAMEWREDKYATSK